MICGMLISIYVIAFVYGVYALITGRIAVSQKQTAMGYRVHLAGLILVLIYPIPTVSAGITFGLLVTMNANFAYDTNTIVRDGVILQVMFSLLWLIGAVYLVFSAPARETRDPKPRNILLHNLSGAIAYTGMSDSEFKRLWYGGQIPVHRGFDRKPTFYQDVLDPLVAQLKPPSTSTATASTNANNALYQAIAKLNGSITQYPQSATNYFERGKLYHQAKRQFEAAADFARVLRLDPEHPTAENMKRYIAQWGNTAPNPLLDVDNGIEAPLAAAGWYGPATVHQELLPGPARLQTARVIGLVSGVVVLGGSVLVLSLMNATPNALPLITDALSATPPTIPTMTTFPTKQPTVTVTPTPSIPSLAVEVIPFSYRISSSFYSQALSSTLANFSDEWSG